MKTLVIYEVYGEGAELEFFLLDGDYSRLDGIEINCTEHPHQQEFKTIFYDENWNQKIETVKDPMFLVNEDYQKVAVVREFI